MKLMFVRNELALLDDKSMEAGSVQLRTLRTWSFEVELIAASALVTAIVAFLSRV